MGTPGIERNVSRRFAICVATTHFGSLSFPKVKRNECMHRKETHARYLPINSLMQSSVLLVVSCPQRLMSNLFIEITVPKWSSPKARVFSKVHLVTATLTREEKEVIRVNHNHKPTRTPQLNQSEKHSLRCTRYFNACSQKSVSTKLDLA
jgi:hypothetical protein